jgi:nicotinic acid mononucleotide adenylyltransferase
MRLRLPQLADRMRDVSPALAADVADAGQTWILLVDLPTPDVSSTAIRACCARGQSIAGLVPPAVESHIHRHALYRAGDVRLSRGSTERRPANLLHEQEHL